jgi:8-oxo-dGTP pyrophosphatase MutT (NUDIX family)
VLNGNSTGGFLRHVAACNNASLPGKRLPFRIGAQPVGWVLPTLAAALARFPSFETGSFGVRLADPPQLQPAARCLAGEGQFRWRGEEFDVRAEPDGPVLARLDRGALPIFGVEATGVHVNGLVERGNGPFLWVARRAADKALDPGKFDHVVAGGVPAGLGPAETLVKEAWEEAGISAELARHAVPVGVIRYAMERTEGLRRDLLHCYDLELPESFRPRPIDGEVEGFELWPLTRVMETVGNSDAFKFNVNLVLIDLFLRRGLITGPEARSLRRRLSGDTPAPA